MFQECEENVEIEHGAISYRAFKSTMDYLEEIIDSNRHKCKVKHYGKGISSCLKPAEEIKGLTKYTQVKKIIDLVNKTKTDINAIWISGDDYSRAQRREMADECMQECIEQINKLKMSERTMAYLVNSVDKKENSKIARSLFNILFSTAHEGFFHLIEESRTKQKKLVEDADGELELYGIKYKYVEV